MKEKSIEQFTNDLVAEWVDSGKVTLRPAEKKALKDLIAAAVPEFLAVNSAEAFDKYLRTVRQRERTVCVQSVVDLPEPIAGLVNKQRVLNACRYADSTTTFSNRPEPSDRSQPNAGGLC